MIDIMDKDVYDSANIARILSEYSGIEISRIRSSFIIFKRIAY